MRQRRWVIGATSPRGKLSAGEKAAIATACQKFIDEVLKPRFLPRIRPAEFNYPIDIRGRWHGANYRFMQRYRSGHADNRGLEFDAPFARLEYIGRDRFHISYHRHTGQWFRLYSGCTLAGALKLIETDGHHHPL